MAIAATRTKTSTSVVCAGGAGKMIDLILGALCEVRSDAHVAQHGGLAADSAWHVANGELPTCGQEGAVKAPQRAVDRSFDSERGDESKSRFCRKKWFC